jgi:peptidyl-prolyl cis-trans isomerase C
MPQLSYKEKPESDLISASHILVDTEELAISIKKQLDEGADFSKLANDNSTCPSSYKGGDLGKFSKGMMVIDFEDAAFALGVGEISSPVKTQYGYHIIKRTA